MSGPWEKYQAQPQTPPGPWNKYTTPRALAAADARAMESRSRAGPLGAVEQAAEQLMAGRMLGFSDEISGVGAAARTGVRNLLGHGPGYGMSDAYEEFRRANSDANSSFQDRHPAASVALQVAGGLRAPGTGAAGKFVTGAKSLPGAIARGIAVGDAYGAVSGAGAAQPGNRVAGAVRGGALGAVLGGGIPMTSAAASKGASVVAGTARNLQRAVGAADPARVAQLRLAAALAKDAKAGVDPRANLSGWAGSSNPTLADVAGENTRAAVRDAGSQGPARNTLQQYRNQVGADLQGHAIDLTHRLTPGDARTAPALIQGAEGQAASLATPPQTTPPGAGGAALSQALTQQAGAAKNAVDEAYAAARAANPEQAQLPRDKLGPLAASVREAVTDFSPRDIPRVASHLADLDSLNAPTARDLFELRSRLSNLRASNDPVEATAAGRATRALDGQIEQAADGGHFTGDPSVIGLWRNAINQRRQYGQMYEGDDLAHALTEMSRHGAGRALSVAPEDASNAILGRNGVVARPDLNRDLSRLAELLGQDHPALGTLRTEATERLLGQGATPENYGAALLNFQRNNPALAEQVLAPGAQASTTDARTSIADALARRGAVTTGQGILGGAPDQFALDVGGVGDANMPLARVGGRQSLTDRIGSRTDDAVGAINPIATGTNTRRNLSTLYGQDSADAYRAGLQAELGRMENAKFMAPNDGSQTASKHMDLMAQLLHGGHALVDVAKNALGGGPLTDAERAAMVNPAIGDLSPDLVAALLKARPSQGMLPGTGYAPAPIAALAASAAQ